MSQNITHNVVFLQVTTIDLTSYIQLFLWKELNNVLIYNILSIILSNVHYWHITLFCIIFVMICWGLGFVIFSMSTQKANENLQDFVLSYSFKFW